MSHRAFVLLDVFHSESHWRNDVSILTKDLFNKKRKKPLIRIYFDKFNYFTKNDSTVWCVSINLDLLSIYHK